MFLMFDMFCISPGNRMTQPSILFLSCIYYHVHPEICHQSSGKIVNRFEDGPFLTFLYILDYDMK